MIDSIIATNLISNNDRKVDKKTEIDSIERIV